MIAFILAKKILSLFLMMAMGVILVKSKGIKVEDSRSISLISLYLITPCAIFSAFQMAYTPQILKGLILAAAAAIILHIIMIILTKLLEKPMKLDAVEKASIIYSNAGNLIIPIVTAIFGKEWVIYSAGYLSVQTILLWSHGRMTVCGEKKVDVRKIFMNINILAAVAGLVCFILGAMLPAPMLDAVDSVGTMIGPSAMIVTGVLIGSMDFQKIFSYRRLWFVSVLRLIIYPLIGVAFLKFSGITGLVPEGATILMITLLAMTTPSASTVTQMAQVYGKDADYASAINVVTTLCCIFTMPLMVTLYQM
ncbi:AEC family transporter [Frisingicoccus sp.]|uniref:AEC family transporter n=1 Tax=Frisingicoccus sp. TaxID=1918627 RepID=UPI003AB70553